MFSCARPAKLASSCSVSSAAISTPSSSSTSRASRSDISVITCQASGDSRSRSDVAVRCAERTSDSAEPNFSSLCSASATTFEGCAREVCEAAPQITSSRCTRSIAGSTVGEPLPASRCMPSARNSRSVASARSR